MGKKCKKAKWLSGEALQIAVKRREVKSKGEKERYKHLNAEFQRIARRNKKAFFSDQCKEIEENNRMGKTRDLFKKIRDNQRNISCKDGLDKEQKWYGAGASRQSRSGPKNVHGAAEKENYSKRLQQRWGREVQTRLHKGKRSDTDFIQHLMYIQESLRKTRQLTFFLG